MQMDVNGCACEILRLLDVDVQAERLVKECIDYFPTNFIVQDGLLWYIDYECNTYMEEWSFQRWGIQYWSRTPAFEACLQKG